MEQAQPKLLERQQGTAPSAADESAQDHELAEVARQKPAQGRRREPQSSGLPAGRWMLLRHPQQQLLPLGSRPLPGDIQRHAVLLHRSVARGAVISSGLPHDSQQLLHVLSVVSSRAFMAEPRQRVANLQVWRAGWL